MQVVQHNKSWLVISCLVILVALLQCKAGRKPVDFTTEIKPIFNKHCITCHGGVRQKGGFSLLTREEAMDTTESGKRAIIPGDPEHSELIRRIALTDPEERMPYQHEPLGEHEASLLRRWIAEGAKWGEHWAYVPVQAVEPPDLSDDWIRNPIDRFILSKQQEQGIRPSALADKQTLLRRVALDLIGMPAPASLAKQFLTDNSSQAYEKLVDSLLASHHFGEKWTSLWLDLARYADTKGYERDDSRTIWRYRDWLIRAFNSDLPYDQFLTRQLAGDLLPGATDEDYIATAFHRNTMTNDEGGTDNEEFRTAAVIDRVNTTWQALMGTTFGCVQCHSHPYDPFRQEEYYRFMAFFNDTRDEDTYDDYPLLRHFDNDSLRRQLAVVSDWVRKNGSEAQAREAEHFLKTWQPAINSLRCDQFTNSELSDTKWLAFRNHARCRLSGVDLTGKTRLIFRFLCWPKGGGRWEIHIDSVQGPLIASTGFASFKKDQGWQFAETAIRPVEGVHDLFFSYDNPILRDPEYNAVLFDWFYFTGDFPGKGRPGYEQAARNYRKLMIAPLPTTPVMMDNPRELHRATQVFERGNWLVKGKQVEAGLPASLPGLPENAPHNRLGLATWIVSKQNPLTARTLVNRFWEQLFGTGLVETLEDLGSQGTTPTHPELLDWLSYQFMHSDAWSMKKLLKRIVLSATYSQDSRFRPELVEKDPNNRLYARAPRIRLSAEQLRDQALCISGAFFDSLYGPSVFPWQPPGIWLSPWNGLTWDQSPGHQQYRRALYTYWKRSAAYPSMLNFDGVSREVCTARRIRTNTPLQALTTLNDSVYLDLSRKFAQRMRREGGTGLGEQLSAGFEWATGHAIAGKSLTPLMELYQLTRDRFRKEKDKAAGILAVKKQEADPELAALTVVANAILNLDEVITRN